MRISFLLIILISYQISLYGQQIDSIKRAMMFKRVEQILKQIPTKQDSLEWEKHKDILGKFINIDNIIEKENLVYHLWNLNKLEEIVKHYQAIKLLPKSFFEKLDKVNVEKLEKNNVLKEVLQKRGIALLDIQKNVNSYQGYNRNANEMLGKIALLKKDYKSANMYFYQADFYPINYGFVPMPCGQPYFHTMYDAEALREFSKINISSEINDK